MRRPRYGDPRWEPLPSHPPEIARNHKLAVIVYEVLGQNTAYFEPKPKPQTEKTKRRVYQKSIRELELGI